MSNNRADCANVWGIMG